MIPTTQNHHIIYTNRRNVRKNCTSLRIKCCHRPVERAVVMKSMIEATPPCLCYNHTNNDLYHNILKWYTRIDCASQTSTCLPPSNSYASAMESLFFTTALPLPSYARRRVLSIKGNPHFSPAACHDIMKERK